MADKLVKSVEQEGSGLIPYYLYIIPDFGAANDLTNLKVREAIGDRTFNSTLITGNDMTYYFVVKKYFI